jgi:hypothetical protein
MGKEWGLFPRISRLSIYESHKLSYLRFFCVFLLDANSPIRKVLSFDTFPQTPMYRSLIVLPICLYLVGNKLPTLRVQGFCVFLPLCAASISRK